MNRAARFAPTRSPHPVSLDGISGEHARALRGRQVVGTFLSAEPPDTLRGFTMVGAADRGDGAGLRGNRLDVDTGKRPTVAGVLPAGGRPPAVVNRQFVPGRTEVRVRQ